MCLLIWTHFAIHISAINSTESSNRDRITCEKYLCRCGIAYFCYKFNIQAAARRILPPSMWHCHSHNRALCLFLRAFACWNIETWNKGRYFTFTKQCNRGGTAGTLMCSRSCSIWLTGPHWLHKTQVVNVKMSHVDVSPFNLSKYLLFIQIFAKRWLITQYLTNSALRFDILWIVYI